MSSFGWAQRERGILAPAVICSMCGRRAYSRKPPVIPPDPTGDLTATFNEFRCDGCGEPERGCFCPDARVSA